MKLVYSDHFKKRLQKKLQKSPKLKIKISKQLKFLSQDINHPSLRTHKLKGLRSTQYAVWVEGDLRILFVVVKDYLLLTDIITHDEY